MKNLIEIYDEAEQENIKVLEHKIGDRKSIIAHTPNWTAIALNKRLIEMMQREKRYYFTKWDIIIQNHTIILKASLN